MNFLFCLQACRGGDLDDGVEVDSADGVTECSFSQYLSAPVDTAVMYATAPGKPALHQSNHWTPWRHLQ